MCDWHVALNIVKKVHYVDTSTKNEGYDILEV